MRVYTPTNVYDALLKRLDFIFERYEEVYISVSGGKDSTLLFNIAYDEAVKRGRTIHAFFLDQEAEYASTIEIIRDIMYRQHTVPHWYQVPIRMTNATSYEDEWLYAWGPGEAWMREKDPLAIHAIEGEYPQRFYPFFDWHERTLDPTTTCSLVGLRSEESLNRYRAVIKNPALPGIYWSSKAYVTKFYPIYDWSFDDIFYHFYHHHIKYNRIYDYLHIKDKAEQITKMRVSNLIHEKAFVSLTTLQEFEPDTYNRLVKRLKGVHTAALYANEATMFHTTTRPPAYKSWRAYRDFLLDTVPTQHKDKFVKRFAGQRDTEQVARGQCRQLLLNDWENNLPVQDVQPEVSALEKWRALL